MELARKANEHLANGENEEYVKYCNDAFELEKEAAQEVVNDFNAEPTRSVLLRSAATLAFNIGKYQEARKLIFSALSGNPYPEIEQELEELLRLTEESIKNRTTTEEAVTFSYVELLRSEAINLKVDSKEQRYSKAVKTDSIVDLLKNFQISYSAYSEINFRKTFNDEDFQNFDKSLKSFKKEAKTLCVNLEFKSFGVSIVADTKHMNYNEFTSEKFKQFKKHLFEDFKNEVILADFNSEDFQQQMENKYNPQERDRIFAPIIESFDEKSNYRVSVVDNKFKKVIKNIPLIDDKAKSKLLMGKDDTGTAISGPAFLKRTFELINADGSKAGKVLSDQLEYGEFKVLLRNLVFGEKAVQFTEPYDLKVIFNQGLFVIDDLNFKVYEENKDYTELLRNFSKDVIEKYTSLLEQEKLSSDDLSALNFMKSNIVKMS